MGNTLRPRREITIALLGIDGAGKSSLLRVLTEDEEDTPPLPTVGYTTRSITQGRYKILLAEVGGGTDIRSIWPKYYAQCHGVIYMIDGSSTRDRIIESKEVLHKVLLDERIRGKPLLVLCNKNDITTCIKPEELVNILDLSKLLQDSINNGLVTHIITRVWSCTCLKASGRTDQRLRRAMKWLLQRITLQWSTLSVRVEEQHNIELEEKERAKQARIEERKRRIEEEEKIESEDKNKEQQATTVPITVIAEVEPVTSEECATTELQHSNISISHADSSESTASSSRKVKTAKILRKVKRRNKLVPINDPTSFSSRPALLSPWITNGVKLPSAVPDTSSSVWNRKLVPISNHHSSTLNSFTDPQDVFLFPPIAEY